MAKPSFDDFRQSILMLRYLLPKEGDNDIEELERRMDAIPPPDQPVGSWQLSVPDWWKKKREADEVTHEARAERYRTAWIVTTIALIVVVILFAVLK
jgi:hypothetical protein